MVIPEVKQVFFKEDKISARELENKLGKIIFYNPQNSKDEEEFIENEVLFRIQDGKEIIKDYKDKGVEVSKEEENNILKSVLIQMLIKWEYENDNKEIGFYQDFSEIK